VLHDGSRPYPGVLECIQQLSQSGKRLIILSNSSKRLNHSIKMLKKLGFNPDDFHSILTSGEVCHRMLSGDSSLQCETWGVLQELLSSGRTKAIVLGSGSEDVEYIETAGWTLAKDVSEADLIIARGTFTIVDGQTVTSKKENAENYQKRLEEVLEQAARLNTPMFICNPDKVRPDEGLPPMPGALGDGYVETLQRHGLSISEAQSLVKRIGKPYREMYELALASIGGCSELAKACTVMVGDALETDVTGGMEIGCATVWIVKDGIHGATVAQLEDAMPYEHSVETVVKEFNDAEGFFGSKTKMGQESGKKTVVPTFVVPNFRWE